MQRPKNPAHGNCNAWRQVGAVIWLPAAFMPVTTDDLQSLFCNVLIVGDEWANQLGVIFKCLNETSRNITNLGRVIICRHVTARKRPETPNRNERNLAPFVRSLAYDGRPL